MVSNEHPVIALTGATGFLGSHLMAQLLRRGKRLIILGRSTKEEPLPERIARLLRWFGMEAPAGKLETVEIDFSLPDMGIPEATHHRLSAMTGQIIHCASDTNFSERKRELVFAANVHSLGGILEFAAHGHAKAFHYISTAYVAGISDAVCRETLPRASAFVNVYEESKARAEAIIASFCGKNSIPLTIIRPSIVYGDSRTGRSLKFNALYFPIKTVQYIKDIYLNDIRNNGGKKAQKSGIFIDDEGYLHLPLRVYLPQTGSINLIPVDYFVAATLKIIAGDPPGGIFHLTSNSAPTLAALAAYNKEFMKIRDVEIIYGQAGDHAMRNPVEELFDRFIEPYRPYLSDNRIFDRANTDRATGHLQPPEFTNEIFKKCMDYAIRVDWGGSIFAEKNDKDREGERSSIPEAVGRAERLERNDG
jgi:nucleoside-diphosphate-sugar epimerase